MRHHFTAAKSRNISFLVVNIADANMCKGKGHTLLMTGKVGVTLKTKVAIQHP